MHEVGIMHGALNPKKIMVKTSKDGLQVDSVCLIGFGKSTESKAIDDKAIDLRLLGILLLR